MDSRRRHPCQRRRQHRRLHPCLPQRGTSRSSRLLHRLPRARRGPGGPGKVRRHPPPPIAEVLERWEGILFPIVLIGLGIVILVSGGAFGL